MSDLLLELFSEEIPARMQNRAAEDLKRLVTDALQEQALSFADAQAFSTPRRLTLSVRDILATKPATREERRGPRTDAPQKAIEGFCRGAGVTKQDLQVRADKKGDIYVAIIETPARPASDILGECIPAILRSFPWPKSMRWSEGSFRWVRPLHSILCVLEDPQGAQIVAFEVDGIVAGDQTMGHRFMASETFQTYGLEAYEQALRERYVILRPQERRDRIWEDALAHAARCNMEVVRDEALLSEVAGLVEWPVVLMGDIADAFLDLPAEVLQTSMRTHQKFFAVRNPASSRIEKFITVANRETADEGATILRGNQKVLSARLADAKFFWDNDLLVARAGMDVWTEKLKTLTFHHKLGSVKDQVDRIVALSRVLAPMVGAKPTYAAQAAQLSKADLPSEMVYEFPELQGTMGAYYAQEAGKPPDVVRAIREHRSPLGPSDDTPVEPVSIAVALADKLDTLAAFWAIGETPSGSKDPFALRRAALGVIRLLLENDVRLDLEHLQNMQRDAGLADGVASLDTTSQADLIRFFHERLKVYLRERDIAHDVIDACLATPGNGDLSLLSKRAAALQAFRDTQEGENLVQGFKRANNILSQAEAADGVEYSYGADAKFMREDTEKALLHALEQSDAEVAQAIAAEDFVAAMACIARLRNPIDMFFEATKINVEQDIIRRNRLNLLGQVRETCRKLADLSRLEG